MSHPNPVVIADSGVPEVEQEPVQDWYFTFGYNHTHPTTGDELGDAYVTISGTYIGAREQMVAVFGPHWCDQYGSAESAGVKRFDLRRVELPLVDEHDARETYAQSELDQDRNPTEDGFQKWKASRTPAEERTGISDVQHAVSEEVAALRREIDTFSRTSAEYGRAQAAFGPGGVAREAAAARAVQAAGISMAARLDRIEQWTRGGAS